MSTRIEKIGNATLYLADCRDVLPTLLGVSAIVTDPPYGIGFDYHGYDDTRENLVALLADVMPTVLRTRAFVLCGPTQIGLYPQADWVCCVTWNTTVTFGKYGYSQWTPVLCYGADLQGFGNVNGEMKGDTLRISGGASVGFQRDADEREHTCPKPLGLMKLVVNRLTAATDVVCDPFMGSGTTGVACANLGRSFIGIEREPKYFEIACRRIEDAQRQGRLIA